MLVNLNCNYLFIKEKAFNTQIQNKLKTLSYLNTKLNLELIYVSCFIALKMFYFSDSTWYPFFLSAQTSAGAGL